MRHGVERDNLDDVTAFLDSEAPGIFEIESAVPAKYRQSQIVALESWYATLPHEDFRVRASALLGVADDFGLDPTVDPRSRLAVQLMRGQLEAARSTALDEVFSASVTTYLDSQRTFAQPLYRELVEDPRVQSALEHWLEELEIMQDNVARYLATLSEGDR